MSGILKRKLEEGPAPYLALQGSEDDEVSCSDSGNSSDSLNHPVSSGLLDCKVTLPQSNSRERSGSDECLIIGSQLNNTLLGGVSTSAPHLTALMN